MGVVRGAISVTLAGMSIFVPVLVIGALAGAALAMDTPEVMAQNVPQRLTNQATASVVMPMQASETVPGLGAYLIGAISDLNGKPDVALQGYLRALSEDPDNMELRQRTFELALMAGDVPNAVRLARSMPEIEQTTMTRLAKMADYAHAGNGDKACKMARDVMKVSPELLQFTLLEAYLDFANGKPVADIVKRLESQPQPGTMNGRRNYHIARLWLKAGDTPKALTALQLAHAQEPGAVGSTILLAETLARNGQADAAAAVVEAFRAENPAVALLVPTGREMMTATLPPFASSVDMDLAATLADFGLLVWAQGALGPARQVINLSLWLNPQDVHTRYYAAMLMEMGNDLPAATDLYTSLIDGEGVPAQVKLAAQIRLAEVQFRSGDEETPWRSLRMLARDNPKIPSLQRSVAQLAFNRGDFNQAIDSYTALIDSLPAATPQEARAELLFARGAAFERDGNITAATRDLQEALKLTPTNAQILNYLGYMWVDKDMRIDEAFELLQKAHLLAPEDGAITDSLGWAYYKQGDYATAMTYLVMATEQDPESPEIYDHLGDAYAKLGRKDDAKREWQRALDLLAEGHEAPYDGFEKRVKRKLR